MTYHVKFIQFWRAAESLAATAHAVALSADARAIMVQLEASAAGPAGDRGFQEFAFFAGTMENDRCNTSDPAPHANVAGRVSPDTGSAKAQIAALLAVGSSDDTRSELPAMKVDAGM